MRTKALSAPLRRRQLDQTLAHNTALRELVRPRRGWVHEIRNALGMSGAQLAARLGVRQSTVAKLERAEEQDSITLKTLRNAAQALDCDLVYALVPRQSLEVTLERQATRHAARLVGRVEHTMGLEGQSGSDAAVETQIRDLAAEFVRTMSSDIWQGD